MVSSSLLDVSRDLVEHSHKTAVYYEDKKYRLLMLSIGLIGFAASFTQLFVDSAILLSSGVVLLIFSFLSVLFYMYSSVPRKTMKLNFGTSLHVGENILNKFRTPQQNYLGYLKKLSGLTEKQIVEANIADAFTFMYLSESKISTISRMNALIFIGVILFVGLVVAHAITYLA